MENIQKEYLPADSERFFKIVEKMNLISKSRGANFLIIIENVNTNPESCLINEPYSKELIVKLRKKIDSFCTNIRNL